MTLGDLKTAIALAQTLDSMPDATPVVLETFNPRFSAIEHMRSAQTSLGVEMPDGNNWAFVLSILPKED